MTSPAGDHGTPMGKVPLGAWRKGLSLPLEMQGCKESEYLHRLCYISLIIVRLYFENSLQRDSAVLRQT